MNVIFLGPPGVGKGTQAAEAATTYQIPHISTGDMMRQAIADNSPLSVKVKGYLDSGRLVPDELVVDLVVDRLSHPDCQRGCILDGFPRTRAQAEALGQFLQQQGREISVVVQLTADTEILQQRMLERAAKEGRSDDTPQTIARRLEVYQQQTAELVDYYRQAGRLQTVDGVGTPQQVAERIRQLLDRYTA